MIFSKLEKKIVNLKINKTISVSMAFGVIDRGKF